MLQPPRIVRIVHIVVETARYRSPVRLLVTAGHTHPYHPFAKCLLLLAAYV